MDRFSKNKGGENLENTIKISTVSKKQSAHQVIMKVYSAMRKKGYDPTSQIVGYLMSGDPTFITSYENARYLIKTLERDELIEELVRTYIEQYSNEELL